MFICLNCSKTNVHKHLKSKIFPGINLFKNLQPIPNAWTIRLSGVARVLRAPVHVHLSPPVTKQLNNSLAFCNYV